MGFRIGLASACLCLLAACGPRLHSVRLEFPAASTRLARAPGPACNDWAGYLPDPALPAALPVRQLRVNFHVLDNTDSTAHRPADSVRVFLRELLRLANVQLDTNERNWQSPQGTPTLPKRYRYALCPQPGDDGMYFHYDDSLYYFVSMGKYQNNYDQRVVRKYGIGLDSIVNIFLQVHPRDSFSSKTYRANGQGIALGNALKMAGVLESREGPDSFDGLLNHEIGHILGISHAWTTDGCPDTNPHANKCWSWVRDKSSPCNTQATNNVMDYNAYQVALSPCQIGRIQAGLADENSRVRKCLIPNWCSLQPGADVVIADSVSWTGARDLEGHLTIATGGALRLSCRLSMPAGARITVQPGGRLWLDGCRIHNACGKNWSGIFVQEINGQKGIVHTLRPPVLENTAP